ncbi:MAG: hypothetical protein QOE58_2783, partial [Actinomycetota bacterium]|nr:hypothetical protein [Actinomycetota bacterium]
RAGPPPTAIARSGRPDTEHGAARAAGVHPGVSYRAARRLSCHDGVPKAGADLLAARRASQGWLIRTARHGWAGVRGHVLGSGAQAIDIDAESP